MDWLRKLILLPIAIAAIVVVEACIRVRKVWGTL